MELSKTIEELGKYFNEILGFLLPGLTLIALFYYFCDFNQIKPFINAKEINIWVIVIFGYILGYAIYGISLYHEKIKDIINKKISVKIKNKIGIEPIKEGKPNKDLKNGFGKLLLKYTQNERKIIECEIISSQEYTKTIDALTEIKIISKELQNEFNSIRNYALSYVPESDQKTYTFMFRADLFEHLRIIIYIVCTWAFLSFIWPNSLPFIFCINREDILVVICPTSVPFSFFINTANIWIVMSLFFLNYPLLLGRRRFLKIALKLPLSAFLAKYYSF